MLLAELLPVIRTYWPLLVLSALAIHLLRNKFNNGLNKYPGHPLAAYTNWWRFSDALRRKAEKTHVGLHRKYGDIVRLGPNVLSFADPRAIKIIIGDFLSYAGPVGQQPFLDLVLEKNPIKLAMQRWGISKTVFPVTRFANDQAAKRASEMEKIKLEGSLDEGSGRGVDLLMKFTQAQHDHPEFMTDRQVLSSCTSMIFAGSETTAISLSSIFYHLVKHPR
ncbi:hypothetical protein B0A55_03767 [Friedmanniomyces simplex]|uniref:Pisatin demethylase n=1 Tax=Friedmanniomyces simplex TaxID=329884 RepID=A0A4U0XPB8_9PEZI|nr:hypothetical protein B0A55_03767 [Friedmanniomyces simplex]